ncbi:hypothetical protein CRG98_022787 [Punica granatum]|uniref:Uncharacterized protein n=1 Tax=Punica granatum TaxID=22663 RepID=A0A2I0JKN4_PUNGR|nr:hypothetical protein CRG98_022787 [Punica granatum]
MYMPMHVHLLISLQKSRAPHVCTPARVRPSTSTLLSAPAPVCSSVLACTPARPVAYLTPSNAHVRAPASRMPTPVHPSIGQHIQPSHSTL